jgi:murein DD-endopeptidase MepM/ murein hydrolase activator NlpD
VEGEITQSYSDAHHALDIATKEGTPVVAAAGGIVVTAEWDDKLGNFVILSHVDGFATHYTHLSDMHVSAGQTVERGEVIGAAGSTGWATGPHLHFEVHQGEKRINPLTLLPGNDS